MTDGALVMSDEVNQAFAGLRNLIAEGNDKLRDLMAENDRELRQYIDAKLREFPCVKHGEDLAKIEQKLTNGEIYRKHNLDWFKVFTTMALVGLAILTYFRK